MMLITFIQWTNFNVQTCPDKWPMHMVHTVSSKNERKRNSLPVIIPMMDENKRITLKWTIPWIFSYWVLNISPCNEMGLHMSGKEKTLTLEGIKPTTSGFHQLLLYQLHYKAWGQVCVRANVHFSALHCRVNLWSIIWVINASDTNCSLCPDINWRKKMLCYIPIIWQAMEKQQHQLLFQVNIKQLWVTTQREKAFFPDPDGLLTWIWYA